MIQMGAAGVTGAIAGVLAMLTGGAVLAQQAAPAKPAVSRLAKGYLPPAPIPDIVTISPAPPAAGSATEARDLDAARAAVALRGGPRWTLAQRDADLFGPAATGALSCAAGVAIVPATTPRLDTLLRRSATDLGLSGYAIKRSYQRARPFMANGAPSCTPDWEPMLRKDGSYPSGHSAIGYGWSLILAQLLPQRAAILVARGRAFGDSRRVCNVHWLSDVEEGRISAAMTVARLNAERGFRKDFAAARRELRRNLRKGAATPADCAAEAQALDLAPTSS